MNAYPDPARETSEPLLIGEPEYREYPPALPQPGNPVTPFLPPGYTPTTGMPVSPTRVPPYPYGSTTQSFQPLTQQSMPSSPTAKKSSRGWIILLSCIGIAILVLGGILISAFSQIFAYNFVHSVTTHATATPSSNQTSQPGVVNLNQSITVNGLNATVLSVDPLAGDGTINPDAGNTYKVVHIQLQNHESTAQFYTSLDFHVFNGENQERDVEILAPSTYTADQQLFEDDLAPNDTVEGDLIIQVPVNDHNVKLGWSPSNVTPDSAYEWNLGL